MSIVAPLPSPCLVAILLVCNTRAGSGAQILFHYPPKPLSRDESHTDATSSADAIDGDDTSTDSEYSTTDEDDIFDSARSSGTFQARGHRWKAKPAGEDDDSSPNILSTQQNGTGKQTSEPLFGLAEDGLVSLLTPDRTWHKRRFELSINDLVFVGRPVFARPDGSWHKSKKYKQQNANIDLDASDTATDNEKPASESGSSGLQTAKSQQKMQGRKSSLTMFHVVFVMNPPPLEHTLRVKDMYDNVIKKFSKILKLEQAETDYVWEQSELMSSIRASESAIRVQQQTLIAEILAKSSLATAMSAIFTSISSSRIAQVTLSPEVMVSFQIPPVTSTSYLPSLTDPPIQPGLWLTTATDIGAEAAGTEGSLPGGLHQAAKHYTLLLKSPPSRIAKDALEVGGPLAAHLPKFVASLRPTKSFYKLSVSTHMPLKDVRMLAQHLIYWRRAVAVPPLHQKDVYIVSPNADMRKLRHATRSYEQQFSPTMPNMPSLPKILSALSGIPKPFGTLIPSTDHKEIYYLALAWLMRNGWVTQLRTFTYIRVDPEVKKLARDRERAAKSRMTNSYKLHKDERGSTKEPVRTRKRPSIVSRPSSDGRQSTDGNWPKHNPKLASLILNPPRASPEESGWLDLIEESLTLGDRTTPQLATEDANELRKYWPLFVKYFNGHVALDTIPVREGLKRRFVWKLLDKVGLDFERGVEDENGQNKAILIPIRHW